MANIPYPISGTNLDEVRFQVFELIREIYEEKIGGADLGDVFSLPGDVLTLTLADTSGLTKDNNELAVDPSSTGGLELASSGLSIKLVATGGLESSASGLGIKLDGTTLTLSASGIKVSDPMAVASLDILDTGADHHISFALNEDLSANKTLNWVVGDANRAITLSGDPTLGNWFNQDVKSTASPTFAGATINGWTVTEPIQVGGFYFNSTGVNPNTELGYGTWIQVAQGQFLVGEV